MSFVPQSSSHYAATASYPYLSFPPFLCVIEICLIDKTRTKVLISSTGDHLSVGLLVQVRKGLNTSPGWAFIELKYKIASPRPPDVWEYDGMMTAMGMAH